MAILLAEYFKSQSENHFVKIKVINLMVQIPIGLIFILLFDSLFTEIYYP